MEPMTFKQIGDEMGISEDAARLIHNRAIRKIRNKLGEIGMNELRELVAPEPEPTDEDLQQIIDYVGNVDILYEGYEDEDLDTVEEILEELDD